MYMKNPNNDEELRDGRMFAVKTLEYNQHLKARNSDPSEVLIYGCDADTMKADSNPEIAMLEPQGSEPGYG
jgi:hypothetical protein